MSRGIACKFIVDCAPGEAKRTSTRKESLYVHMQISRAPHRLMAAVGSGNKLLTCSRLLNFIFAFLLLLIVNVLHCGAQLQNTPQFGGPTS